MFDAYTWLAYVTFVIIAPSEMFGYIVIKVAACLNTKYSFNGPRAWRNNMEEFLMRLILTIGFFSHSTAINRPQSTARLISMRLACVCVCACDIRQCGATETPIFIASTL